MRGVGKKAEGRGVVVVAGEGLQWFVPPPAAAAVAAAAYDVGNMY